MNNIFLGKPGRVAGSVLLALLLNACSDSAEQRATAHLQRGQQYLDAGNTDKARIEFKNVLGIDLDNVTAHFLLGQVHEQMEEWREALTQYNAAIKLESGHVDARLHLGRLYLRGGAPGQALTIANAILKVQPEHLEALQLRASAHMQQNETGKAVADAEQILQLEPGYTDTLILLALHYNRESKPAQAIALLEEGIVSNPDDSTLKYMLARSLSSTGQFQRATELVLELIEMEPQLPEHRVWLATLYAKDGRMADAQNVLHKMANQFPDDLAAKRLIFDFYVGNGDNEKAIEFLIHELAETPDAHELRLYLAELYEKTLQQDSARKTYQDLTSSNTSGIYGLTARNRLAQLLSSKGELDAAGVLIEEILEVSPRDNEALILRGKIALARNQPNDAVMDFRSVLKDQPYSEKVLGLLSTAHLADNNPDLAREALERSIENNPRDAQSRIVLAQLLVAQNEPQRASKLANEALQMAPGHLGAMDTLARILVDASDWDSVLQVADRMVEADPEGAGGYLYSGLAQRRLGDVEKAVMSLGKAMVLAPDNETVLTAYVSALLGVGQSEEAQRQTTLFLDVHPDNQTAQNLIGEVLVFRKNYTAAADAFSKAIILDKRSAVPYRNLGLTLRALGDEQKAQSVFQQGIKAVAGDPRSEAILQPYLSNQN